MNPYRERDQNEELDDIFSRVNTLLARSRAIIGPQPRAPFWRRLRSAWKAFLREMRT